MLYSRRQRPLSIQDIKALQACVFSNVKQLYVIVVHFREAYLPDIFVLLYLLSVLLFVVKSKVFFSGKRLPVEQGFVFLYSFCAEMLDKMTMCDMAL